MTTENGWTEETGDLVFYDGSCGLCHRSVRFLLARDAAGTRFRYAPLNGERFNATFSESERSSLPDSVVVRTSTGATLIRSRAAIHLLQRIGGLWRVLAILARCIPPPILDAAYDAVARIRFRLFARPAEACPLLPADLRKRFDH